jgi:hypothetical protein
VSHYRLDDQGSIPAEAKDFSSSPCVQTGTEVHPTSYELCIVGRARPGRDADYSRPSSAKVKNEIQLYSSSPCRLHGGSGTFLIYYW